MSEFTRAIGLTIAFTMLAWGMGIFFAKHSNESATSRMDIGEIVVLKAGAVEP